MNGMFMACHLSLYKATVTIGWRDTTPRAGEMKFIFATIATVLLPVVFTCSIPPGTRSFSTTERTILAPIVFQATVLNTTIPDDSPGQIFDICVRVVKTFKSPFKVPRELCFGSFGIQELCLTYVYKDNDYLFFVNEDYTARYDGFPEAAVPVFNDTVADVERGHCTGQTPSQGNCVPPVIQQDPNQIMTRVEEGREAFVPCHASGTQPVIATWYRGEQMVQSKQRGNYLFISDATMYDTGRYVCTVKNPAGQVSMVYQIQTLSSSCGKTFGVRENETAIMQSPDFPRPYRRAKACSWRVCPPQGMRLEFSFTTFDLRTFDKLEIINECDQHHFAWRQYCSSKVSPGTFVSRCNTTCMQIILDSGILTNRVATGFQATVKATYKESTADFNLAEMFCKSDLIARVKPTISFYTEFNAEVLEIFRENQPIPIENEISIMHDFSVTDMFGCSLAIQVGTEYYVFASSYEESNESNDGKNAEKYLMDFAVNPSHYSTPASFIQRINAMKDDPPQCETLPA